MAAHFSKSGNPMAEEIQGSSAAQNSDIVWTGDAWLCEKKLKHYPSFSRNQINISVYSFVHVMGNDKKTFLGYVEDLFEDAMGEKMVRMRPFVFGEDIKALVPKLNPQTREVFITTSTELEISTKHIQGPAEILSPWHFNRDQFLTLNCFVCHKSFNKNTTTVKPFSIGKLRGYSTQPIISSLESRAPNPSKRGRRKPTAEARPIILALECIPPASKGKKQTTKGEGLKPKLDVQNQNVESIVPPALSNQNELYVEVLSLDSGLRGCWFRCKILHSKQKQLRVQYCDVIEVDSVPEKHCEECVNKYRVANPDKFGMRCEGRPIVRPWPQWNSSDIKFELGVAVDAWLYEAWWEGVIAGDDISSNDKLQVYFPGEHNIRSVKRKYLRVSKDWVNNQWVAVKPTTDMISFLKSEELQLVPIEPS